MEGPAIPGAPLGEGWGRLWVTAQVGRWLRGQAPWGTADLLAWPQGMPFWPTDPLVQAVQVPLSALLGDAAALTAVTGLLLWLAGVGPHALARRLGAGPLGAAIAGLLVQGSPFVLRHGADLVLEALALGPAALAGAAVVAAHRAQHPSAATWLAVLAGVGATAATSPYLAVYLALVCGLCALATPRRWRRWAGVALAGAGACLLVLLPLWAAERGEQGRLGVDFAQRGYHLAPTAVVHPSTGARAAPRPPPSPAVGAAPSPRPPAAGPAPRPSALERLSRRVPGGAALLLASLSGLAWRPTRALSALALLLLLLSPEPWLTAAALQPRLPRFDGPLDAAMGALPMLSALGNAGRVVGAFVVVAAVIAARLCHRQPLLAPVLLLLGLAEAQARFPGLALPATPVQVQAGLLQDLDGPTVFFPSGDPPAWHPAVAPKELLFLAGRAGVPVAYDYGRGRIPVDLPVQARLSVLSDAPIGVAALRVAPALPDQAAAWAALPFRHLVILEERLAPEEVARLRPWLQTHATLAAEGPGWSRWAWPDRF